MSYIFGDGFDLYAAAADALLNYWDGGTSSVFALFTGRFTGSQAIGFATTGAAIYKISSANDAVHHIVCAFQQSIGLSGTVVGGYIQLLDGTTAQCSIVFRSDGAILLTSGGPTGTTLATYTGAFVANTWTAYEFEVVINNTTGSFAVRKNGSGSNDFSATSLNTRGGTSNNYANRLTLGLNAATTPLNFSGSHKLDDLLWRSDSSSVAWVGDVRCYTRMPASDASAQFSKSMSTYTQTPFVAGTSTTMSAGTAVYIPFTAAFDGTVSSVILPLAQGYTGNMKCSIFASSGSAPTTVLGSATTINNPIAGNNTFTFGTPVSVSKNTQYWVGFDSDTTQSLTFQTVASGSLSCLSTTPYASFPSASPAVTTGQTTRIASWVITIGSNATLTADTTEDGSMSYVQDATVSDADFYNIASLSSTPASTVAVTTRGFCQKSDAGSRVGAVQLKSGATTVQASGALNTSWGWLWRTDTVDPNTSAAWTATAVNSVTIGPTVVS